MSEAQPPQQPESHEAPESPEQRIFTREFKVEAVRLSEHSDKTVAQIARDLGVPERVLYRWRHELREQAERAFPGKGHQSELEEENRRLRGELDLLKQEREVLKTFHVAQGDTPADENGIHSPAASRALRADA
jgi:transposase